MEETHFVESIKSISLSIFIKIACRFLTSNLQESEKSRLDLLAFVFILLRQLRSAPKATITDKHIKHTSVNRETY